MPLPGVERRPVKFLWCAIKGAKTRESVQTDGPCFGMITLSRFSNLAVNMATAASLLQPAVVAQAAFAFRGYNTENLGRSHELWQDERYREIVLRRLQEASEAAAEHLHRDVDLAQYVIQQREPTLEQYGEAVAMIMAMSMAQLDCLRLVHGVEWPASRMLLGYSLGEVSALVASGALELVEALRAPLELADDCVALAEDVTLGVFFSRRGALDSHDVERAVLETNLEREGVMGVSAVLSPNSMLLLGQGDTLRRFHRRMKTTTPERVYMRRNPHRWPPLHTPITWQRNIPTRAAQAMLSMQGGLTEPHPRVLSLVTGEDYTDTTIRALLYRWTDQPQRLWGGVCELFSRGVQTVVHVGPQPNIIPATLRRIGDNVAAQTKASMGMRTLARLANRPWLKAVLPQRTSLLRAPQLQQIVLEDWLLDA